MAALLETAISRPVAGLGSVKIHRDVLQKQRPVYPQQPGIEVASFSRPVTSHGLSRKCSWILPVLIDLVWHYLYGFEVVWDASSKMTASILFSAQTMEGVGALTGVNGSRLWKDLKICHITVVKEWTEVNEHFNIYRLCSVYWTFPSESFITIGGEPLERRFRNTRMSRGVKHRESHLRINITLFMLRF